MNPAPAPDSAGSGLYGSDRPADRDATAFRDGEIPVSVYGLGKMGLPLAAVYADTCGAVTGVDIDAAVVESVERGESHVTGEPGLDDLVAETVERGALDATTDARAAAHEAQIHVLLVPVGLTDEHAADLSILTALAETVAPALDSGDLVLVECTVPPRTCQDRIGPILEEGSGLAVGGSTGDTADVDAISEGADSHAGRASGNSADTGEVGLAFCPERTASGRAIQDIRGAYPKIVGGIDRESTRAARVVYEEINAKGVLGVADATTAEAVKVFEGVYRDTNIALANELARFVDSLGIDVIEAIEAANTQPYCEIHQPGAGVGGHCIPYYPYFLTGGFGVETPLLETARAVNDGMPGFAVEKLREEFAAESRDLAGATVLVLGVAYRPGVAETAATPARPIVEGLSELDANVLVADPVIEDLAAFDPEAEAVTVTEAQNRGVEAVVLVTPHAAFEDIDWAGFENDLVVIDGRDALDLSNTDHRVYTIGRGWRRASRAREGQ